MSASGYSPANQPSCPQFFEHYLAYFEQGLTFSSLIPLLGTITGVIRICLGVIQTVGGIIGGLLSVAFAPFNKTAGQTFNRSMDHVVNGVTNIAVGIFEAIPLLGTVFTLIKALAFKAYAEHRHTGVQAGLLVGYNILDLKVI